MSLARYQIFLTAVELGSLTAAGEALGYTPSNVSYAVAQLEKEWSVRLLTRDKSGVHLTPEGQTLLPYIRRVWEDELLLRDQRQALAREESRVIRVGTFSSVTAQWLPEIFRRFEAVCPDCRFRLFSGNYADVERWLLQGTVDCGFLRLPVQTGLTAYPLRRDPYLAVLPHDHPLATAQDYSIRGFLSEPFIQLEDGQDQETAEIFRKYRITPSVRCTAESDYAVLAMVEAGMGVSLMPQLMLGRLGYRVAVRPLQPAETRTIGIAVRTGARLSRAARSFVSCARSWAKETYGASE